MIDQLASSLDDDALTWELLGAYEACEMLNHYPDWCLMVGLDPRTQQAEMTYRLIHNAYVDMWIELGDGLFFARLEPIADRWKSLQRASERAGKQTLVGAFTRLLGGHA